VARCENVVILSQRDSLAFALSDSTVHNYPAFTPIDLVARRPA
jgi:hypothetical protein